MLLTTVKSLLSQQKVHNESRTTCGGFEWIPSGVSLCRKLVLIAFGLDSVNTRHVSSEELKSERLFGYKEKI